ncbi:hypothetical protein G6F68_020340 [Rhizopus microsporus]|nr:hypothetical protein G6F68_020340 [Rhizopus microsporus]
MAQIVLFRREMRLRRAFEMQLEIQAQTDGLTGIYVQVIDEQPVAIQLPASVVLEVIETPPELKGGTATKRPKPAKLNTGIEIMVPEYIVNGERVLVNTATGEFAGRAD